MDKLRVGVVGAGHLGYYHITNLKEVKTADLVGFYDIDKKRASYVEEETGVKGFSSLESLLENCDAISIVVPTQEHYAVALKAIERGLHFFCEKPFMESVKQAEDIIRKARAKKLIIQVGHVERFNPALKCLRGEILAPLFIESHRITPFNPRGTDVAVILDLMIHDIDIILSLVRSRVVRINATGAPVLSENIDIANARIEFENGCIANVTASRVSQKKMRKMRIFQKNKYISIDFLTRETDIYWLSENLQNVPEVSNVKLNRMKKQILFRKISIPEGNPLKEELEAFIEAVITKKPPKITAEEGLEALKVAVEIEKQVKENLKKIL